MKDTILTRERIGEVQKARYKMYQEKFASMKEILGEDATSELLNLYSIFDHRFYIWLAGLYDPVIGGFYFSESGRDTKGFGPDIESTMQALSFTQTMGLTFGKPMGEAYDEKVKNALVSFTKSLQDPENGYFYHPQWGRLINVPRRGRDLSWSTSLLKAFGESPLYPTPMERLSSGECTEGLPEHLKSVNAFKEYLEQFNLSERSYWIGNQLQAQAIQIKSAGKEIIDTLCSWLEENQRDDNGLWQEVVNYDSVNGLMKLALLYTTLERRIPRAEKGLESAIQVALSNQEIVFCCQFYNPFSTMSSIIHNVAKFEGKDRAESLRAKIFDNAKALIKRTREKVILCRDPDGRYHYNPYGKGDGRRSQMAPVALGGINDPNVNGACICINGTVRSLCSALGIPLIPVFCDEDAALFHELINSAEQYPKIYEKPDWFESCLVPEGCAWE